MLGPRRLAILGAILAAGVGCDVTPNVTQGPEPLPPTSYASVRVEYRQPNGCANLPEACSNRVVFFASWMRPGEEIVLDGAAGHMWVGLATNVPVNWPPPLAAHRVRVYDPFLVETETGGVTAARLRIGGQLVTDFVNAGTPDESGEVYVDANGIGHNPP